MGKTLRARFTGSLLLATLLAFTGCLPAELLADVGDGGTILPQETARPVAVKGPDGKGHFLTGSNAGAIAISNPPQGWIYRYQSVIQDTMSRWAGTQQGARSPDTSAVYKADGATTWVLEILPSYTPTSAGHLLAVSFGRHPVQSRDSLSTFVPVLRYSHPIGVTGSTPPDTLGSMVDLQSNVAQPTFKDSLALQGETVLPLGPGPMPRGRSYQFTGITTDWISLRVRLLQSFTGTSIAASDGTGLVLTFRINLYGYR
jgi:hypothetical protein